MHALHDSTLETVVGGDRSSHRAIRGSIVLGALVALGASACTDSSGDLPRRLSTDGKSDGFSISRKTFLPLEHAETITIDYSDDAGAPADFVYAEFALSGDAHVTFTTSNGADTELAIYKQLDPSWWTQVKQDQTSLAFDLDQGPYRLLLHRRVQAGPATVDLSTACLGDGCTVYTAFPQNAPQVINVKGGPVVAHPHFVAVTFDGDAARTDIEAFIAQIGATDYWRQTASEYGVGPATAGTPVHLSEAPPASLSVVEARAWLAAHLDGTHPEWGTPDDNSFYVMYFPATTTLTNGMSQGCSGFGGYHDAAILPNGQHVVFAAMPRCDSFNGLTGFDITSAAGSHELLEGVTDPLWDHYAYALPDNDHQAYYFDGGGEVGDMCQFIGGTYIHVPGFAYLVQRTWSNAEARAGHDPCVPHVATDPYVIAAPVLDRVSDGKDSSLGVQVAMGESRTIEVDVSSGGPTNTPITLVALDYALLQGQPSHFELTWDRTTASNGDRAHLTIKRTAADPRGFSTFMIGAKTDNTNVGAYHVLVPQ
jgi:hypothetical protein